MDYIEDAFNESKDDFDSLYAATYLEVNNN